MPSLQSCPQKMQQKRLLLSPPSLGFVLVTALLKSNTLAVTETNKKKKKNRFNSPQFSDAYCAQKPLKQLRMQDCHLPCCFYRSCCLMSFTKKRNDNQEGFRALLQSSRSGTLIHFFSVSIF